MIFALVCFALFCSLTIAFFAFRPKSRPDSRSHTSDIGMIYCINLPEQRSRRKHMEELFVSLGWLSLVTWVAPVSATTAEDSLSQTNEMLLRSIASSPRQDWTLIFEDDVDVARRLSPHAAATLVTTGLRDLNVHGDVHVTLGACLWGEEDDASCEDHACKCMCTHAIAYTPSRAASILRGVQVFKGHWDGLLASRCAPPIIIGREFTHDYASPFWRGVFYQNRRAPWYHGSVISPQVFLNSVNTCETSLPPTSAMRSRLSQMSKTKVPREEKG